VPPVVRLVRRSPDDLGSVAVTLAIAAIRYATTLLGGRFDRALLGVCDARLMVPSGHLLYGSSSRDPFQSPGWRDPLRLVAVVAARVLDPLVLGPMAVRIGEFGLTLVSLDFVAWLSLWFGTGASPSHRLARW